MNELKKRDIDSKHFWCGSCSRYFQSTDYSEAALIPDIPIRNDGHDYYSHCPECHEWARSVPHYYANLPKMHTTGPRTVDGKRRSSLNNYKHGMYAQPKHLLAPGRAGRYDICGQCEQYNECEAGEIRYCPYKVDMIAKIVCAFENGDQAAMKQFAGMSVAKVYMILENMIEEILSTGVMLSEPKVSNGEAVEISQEDANGVWRKVQVYELRDNPLLKRLQPIMAALGVTSDQQTMNPKSNGDDGKELDDPGAKVSDPISFLKEINLMIGKVQSGSAADLAAIARAADETYQEATSDKEDDNPIDIQDGKNPFKR